MSNLVEEIEAQIAGAKQGVAKETLALSEKISTCGQNQKA